jgi:hypothetical protein
MYDDRQTILKSAVVSPPHRTRSGLRWVVAVAVLGAVLLFWEDLADPLRSFWWGSLGPLVVQDWQARPSALERADDRSARNVAGADAEAWKSGAAAPTLVPVSLSATFHPVMFQIPAASMPVMLDGNQSQVFAEAAGRRYGTFSFANGMAYRFVLYEAGEESLLAVDLNGNGDFTDDGPPYQSPTDAFEVTVALPMSKVSGLQSVDSPYHLWLYRTPEGRLRQVALTQLAGEISLNGEPYTAYVVENTSIDGDYTNEGVYVDWNGDGRLQPSREYIGPGASLALDAGDYEFLMQN